MGEGADGAVLEPVDDSAVGGQRALELPDGSVLELELVAPLDLHGMVVFH